MEDKTQILGYALDEPSAAACGPIIDRVPDGSSGDLIAEYQRWRSAAETQMAKQVKAGTVKVWVPVAIQPQTVVPFFGGEPSHDWDAAMSLLIKASGDAGENLRIVDLTSLVAPALNARMVSYPGRYAAAELGPGGSLDPIRGFSDPADAGALLADVMRADDDRNGRNAAASAQNLISMVSRHLDASRPLTASRLHAAVSCAVHASQGHHSLLSSAEEAAIVNGPHAQLKHSPTLLAQLFELDSVLSLVAQMDAAKKPFRTNGNPTYGDVSVLSIRPGIANSSLELARDILSARLVRDVASGKTAATVLLGADLVPTRVLDAIATAAESSNTKLFVFFERLTDGTKSRLGWRSSTVTGFFRLANHEDAETAASFLGRQHKMVLAGISDTHTKSFEWGWSNSVSRGLSRSTARAWQLGSLFSSTLTSTAGRSHDTSASASGGGSRSAGTTTSHERVYEYLVEPSVFQGLGEGALLLVDVARRAARLATCSREVSRSNLVDWTSYFEIADR